MLAAFTLFHVVVSLAAIGSGFIVLFGLLNDKRSERTTAFFLATTVLTSVTGFLFPFHGFKPSYGVGILSLLVLAVAILARYTFRLAGGWRTTYITTAITALWLNVFVLIAQSFQKIGPLREIAPTQSAPPFGITQLVVLIVFVVLAVRAIRVKRPRALETRAV